MRIVAVADTHGYHDQLNLPDGTVLLVAGDFCTTGDPEGVESFVRWLGEQPHDEKIVVAGNHEICLSPDDPHYGVRDEMIELIESGAHYLENETVSVCGLVVYGSPNIPSFGSWAFELSEDELRELYRDVPDTVDVLVTHGPPHGVLDETKSRKSAAVGFHDSTVSVPEKAGSLALKDTLYRVQSDVHVFGHIHGQNGRETVNDTVCVNCSTASPTRGTTDDPVVIDL